MRVADSFGRMRVVLAVVTVFTLGRVFTVEVAVGAVTEVAVGTEWVTEGAALSHEGFLPFEPEKGLEAFQGDEGG